MQIYKSQEQLIDDWWKFYKIVKSDEWRRKNKSNTENSKKHLEKIVERMEKTVSSDVKFFLLDLFKKYKLNRDEQMMFMVALIHEISPGYPVKGIKDVLSTLYLHPAVIMKKAKLLMPSAKLVKQELLCIYRVRDSLLEANVVVHPRIIYALIRGKGIEGLKKHNNRVPGGIFIVRNPRVGIDQVVLSKERKKRLKEIVTYLKKRPRLLKISGIKETIEKGTALILLFIGPPGTGKTLAAEAIAKELGKKLYIVNYARLEDRFVGETEKNIETVFRVMERDKAIGLFDEADAVFSNRISPRTATDAAYNREVSLLLQRMEEFNGILILATNREANFDSALGRRITFEIKFDLPEAPEREKIWKILIPRGIKIDKEVDFSAIASRFPFSGGNIKNAVLTAIMKVAISSSTSPVLRIEHLLEAAEEEYSKLQKNEKNHRIGFQMC